MKFWRTSSVAALAVAFSATTAFASLAPKAPAAAKGGSSSGPTSFCSKATLKSKTDGLTLPACMVNETQTAVGNGFPWENSTFFFSSFRNQYLYPSNTINEVQNITCTIESLSARNVSFTGASTNVYTNPSTIAVTDAIADSLVETFALNTGTTSYCSVNAALGNITINTRIGTKGSLLSNCLSCPGTNDSWCQPATTETALAAINNLLVDMNLTVGTGNSGGGVWDTSSTAFGTGCTPGGQRAFGSGSFANPGQHLTTALGVDGFDFVWVFKGTAPPPPATVEQQIKEIVRLLLTPEGLRCSGLDLTPGNDKIEDDPIAFPAGATVDPIQPQISTGGTITGDETVDALRNAGFLP